MSEMMDLMKKIGDGSQDVQDALPEFQNILVKTDPTRPAGDLTYEQEARRSLEDKDDTNTFAEVTAAYFGNIIDADQYRVLRDAVTAKD